MENPDKFGPGLWFAIHVAAVNADTVAKKQEFCSLVRSFINALRCTKCKEHATKYMKDHPPEKYFFVTRDGKQLGMFKWSWEFHNNVNQRLNKPVIEFETALEIYQSTEMCTNCGEQKVVSRLTTVPPLTKMQLADIKKKVESQTPKVYTPQPRVEKTASRRYVPSRHPPSNKRIR